MKKLICVCLLSVFCVLPFSVKADEASDIRDQYQAVLVQLINVLTEQIRLLQAQIADILASQATQAQVLQEQTVLLGQVQQQTTPAPVIPEPVVVVSEVKKEIILLNNNNCGVSSIRGTSCNFEVAYKENGVKKTTEQFTVLSDDSGVFIGSNCLNGLYANSDGTQRNGNTLTCYNGNFDYYPNATGTRTILITANGTSTTLKVYGQQLEKCIGNVKPFDTTLHDFGFFTGCNK